jgi:hypothetical protein
MLREGGRSDDHLGIPVSASPLGGDLQLDNEDNTFGMPGIQDESSSFSATSSSMDVESWSQLFNERTDSYTQDID